MRTRRGVSLIELLIAITVVGIIAASMSRLLLSNSRSTEVRNAGRDARAVSRAAINLLESELRMVEPFGVIAPTNDSTLTVLAPYAFGMVCIAGPGGTAMMVLPSYDDPPSGGADGHAGWAWRDGNSSYFYEPSTSVASDSPASCTTNGVNPIAGGRVVGVPAPTGASTVPAGSVAFLYRQLTYSLRNSTAFPGRLGLYRTAGANGTPEELAAPFDTTSRFQFYIMNQLTPSATPPTFLDEIRGVQFQLHGQSIRRPRLSSDYARAPFVTAVFFQNRPS